MRHLIVKKFEISINEDLLDPEEVCSEDASIDLKFNINDCSTFEITNISFLEKDNLIKSLSTILDDKESKIVFDDFSNIYLETNKETIHFYVNFDKGDGFITNSIKFENNSLVKKSVKKFIQKLEKINLVSEKDFQEKLFGKKFEKEMKEFQENFQKNIYSKPEITNQLIELQEKYSLNVFKNTSTIDNVLFNKFADMLQEISVLENTEEILTLIGKFREECEKISEEVKETSEEVKETSEEVKETN